MLGAIAMTDEIANDPTYSVVLSPDQRAALAQVEEWLDTGEPCEERLRLAGYAGTGKTTIIRYVMNQSRGLLIGVCAFTGKAAYVLRTKGIDATTMHRMIYSPTVRCQACGATRTEFPVATAKTGCEHKKVDKDWVRHPSLPYDLIIVDEASMVNKRLMEDLESFKIPVLYVGDHGQLEPIGDNPGLMLQADIRLEQIHRQAEGSPILKLAHHVRQGFRPETFGDAAKVVENISYRDAEKFDIVICGFNATRVAVNAKIRQIRGFSGPGPVPGDRLICLRNNPDEGMFNGQLFMCTDVRTAERGGHEIPVLDCVDDLGETFESIAYVPAQFGALETMRDANPKKALFDWGYCITAHKSQGSEFDRVVVLEQIGRSWEPARWRYTAVTRAAKEIVYCVSSTRRIG